MPRLCREATRAHNTNCPTQRHIVGQPDLGPKIEAAWPQVGIGTTYSKEVQGLCNFRGIWCFPGFPWNFAPFNLSPITTYTRGLW